MGSAMTRESSPESPVTVRAPRPATLTAFETAGGNAAPAAQTPTPADAPVPAPVPAPPREEPKTANPRQWLAQPHEAAHEVPAEVPHPPTQGGADASVHDDHREDLPETALALPASREQVQDDEAEATVSSPSPSVSPPSSHGADEGADAAQTADNESCTVPSHRSAALNGTTYRPLARSVSPAAGLDRYEQLPLQTVQTALKTNHRVLRICLTGGPCAGKSTMLAQFQSKLPHRIGYDVYCVPEAATMLVTGGMQWNGDLVVEQQTALLRTQLALEDQFYALAAATGRPSIVFSDRGTMDGRAFCSDEQFAEILRRLDCTLDALRDRYDAVIHMVTAAIGAEDYYNLDNPARYEDLDGARASDLKLRQMYVGHPYFRLLDNSTSFDDKIEKGLRLAAQVAGVDAADAEQPVTCHYLLRRACPLPLPVPCASYTTTTTILSNSRMDEIRLVYQRQMPDGSCMHFFRSLHKPVMASLGVPAPPGATAVRRSASSAMTTSSASVPSVTSTLHHHHHRKSVGGWPGQGSAAAAAATALQPCIDTCQRISSKEYLSLLNHRDPMREDVIVEATQFFHDSVSLELITILAPGWAAGKQTMTVECDEAAMRALTFPSFVEVDREVPVDTSTTMFLISHRETGPLYTSLAFAPVFSRTVAAIGAHADVHDFATSTCDSSTVQRAASQLNTPLRPLQALRQNSINGGSRKDSFSTAAKVKANPVASAASPDSCETLSQPVPLPLSAPSLDATTVGNDSRAAPTTTGSVVMDKENAVPTVPSRSYTNPQQQHTPLASKKSSFHAQHAPANATESVEGGEVPERAERPTSATSLIPGPLRQKVVLPPIEERPHLATSPAAV